MSEDIDNSMKKMAAIENDKMYINKLIFAHLAIMAKLPIYIEEFINRPDEETVELIKEIFESTDTGMAGMKGFVNQIAVNLLSSDVKDEDQEEVIQVLSDADGIRLK